MNDFAAAREGLGFPDPSGDSRERLRDFTRLSTEGGVAGLPRLFQRDPEDGVRAELGVGITDVQRTADTGVGPTALTVLEGSFRQSKIERAAEADEVWSDELETTEHAGTEYLSWDGEDFEPRKITPARPLGQGGRLALDRPFLWWTSHTKPIERALDAAAGDRRSLADVREFARLATALAALGAYSVLMTDDVLLPGPTLDGGRRERCLRRVRSTVERAARSRRHLGRRHRRHRSAADAEAGALVPGRVPARPAAHQWVSSPSASRGFRDPRASVRRSS